MRELFESLFVHGKYETLPEKHTSAELFLIEFDYTLGCFFTRWVAS